MQTVPLGLLRFIAEVDFRYGVRSITQLIDLIPRKTHMTHLKWSSLHLPLGDSEMLKDSNLVYHLLNAEQAHGITKLWKKFRKPDIQLPVFLNRVEYANYRLAEQNPDAYLSRILQNLANEGGLD